MSSGPIELVDENGAVVFKGSASPAPGGGSMTFKATALDPITAVSLLDGPITVYTPAAGEEVYLALIAEFSEIDVDDVVARVWLGSDAVFAAALAGTLPFAQVYSGEGDETYAFDTLASFIISSNPATSWDDTNRLAPIADPIKAAIVFDTQSAILSPGGAWQADTDYSATPEAGIVEAGHIWGNGGADGTSGNVKPDFAGNIGGDVTDGAEIDWVDRGEVPTTGSVTFRLLSVLT